MRVLVAAVAAVVLAAAPAWAGRPRYAVSKVVLAAEQQVPVQAEVVLASTAAGGVEAGLEGMQATLGKKVKYGTLKRLSTQRLTVEAKSQVLALPNGKSAELSLDSLKDGVATLRVKLAPTESTYSLARDKAFYLQAGAHEGGDLWLVLSQPKAK